MNTERITRVEGIRGPLIKDFLALLHVVFFAGSIADHGRRDGFQQPP